MSKLVVIIIKFYQKVISPDQGMFSFMFVEKKCRFYPTCSQYAILAIEKYGLLKGSGIFLKRIIKCHPLCEGGVDLLQ